MAVAEKARAEGGRARRRPFFFREAAPSARSLAEANRGKPATGERGLHGGAEDSRPEGVADLPAYI